MSDTTVIEKPRRSKKRIVFTAIALLIASPAIYVGVRFILAHLIIDAHRNDIRQALDDRASKDWGRPRLWGDPLAGNAVDMYRQYYPRFEDAMRDIREIVWNIVDPRLSDQISLTTDRSSCFRVDTLERSMRERPAALRNILSKHREWVTTFCTIPRMSCSIPEIEDGPRRFDDAFPLPVSEVNSATLYLTVNAWVLHHDGFDRQAADLLEAVFIVSNDISRYCRYDGYFRGEPHRSIAIERWREILAHHALSPDDLASMARHLDRIDEYRPVLADAHTDEDLVWRLACLDRLSSTWEVPEPVCGWSPPPLRPSWEHLYSETLFVADLLREVKSHYDFIGQVDRLPMHERIEAVARNVITPGYLPYNREAAEYCYRRDAQCRLRWLLMRIATAIAWYEAENGRFPARLDDLVPKYIADIPLCPLTGKPFGYREGRVWSFGPDGDDDGGMKDIFCVLDADLASDGDAVWVIGRKK